MTLPHSHTGSFLAILTCALLLQPGVLARAPSGQLGSSGKGDQAWQGLHCRHLLQANSTSNGTSVSNSTNNSTSTVNGTSTNTTTPLPAATLPPSPDPNNPDDGNNDNGSGIGNQQLISNQQVNLSPGAVAGIVIGCVVAGGLVIAGTIFVFVRFKRQGHMEQEGSGAPGTSDPRLQLPELNALHDLTKAGASGNHQVQRAPGI